MSRSDAYRAIYIAAQELSTDPALLRSGLAAVRGFLNEGGAVDRFDVAVEEAKKNAGGANAVILAFHKAWAKLLGELTEEGRQMLYVKRILEDLRDGKSLKDLDFLVIDGRPDFERIAELMATLSPSDYYSGNNLVQHRDGPAKG